MKNVSRVGSQRIARTGGRQFANFRLLFFFFSRQCCGPIRGCSYTVIHMFLVVLQAKNADKFLSTSARACNFDTFPVPSCVV